MLMSGSWSRPRGTFSFRACFGGVTLTIASETGHCRAEIKEMISRMAVETFIVPTRPLECMVWLCKGGLICIVRLVAMMGLNWLVIGGLKSRSLV